VAKSSLGELNYRQWKENRRAIGHAAELWIDVSMSMFSNTQCGPGAACSVWFGCWLSLSARLTDPETGLPKQEKPAKRYESSSTTKNKKNNTTTKKKGIAVYSQSQGTDETAILTRQR
jgi:hypothetical protein